MASSDRADSRDIPSLLEEHWPALHAFLRLHAGGVVASKESMSDLAQSVCREALQDAEDFEFRGTIAFKKWLFTQAAHKIADRGRFYRREKRDPAREQAAIPARGNDAQDLLTAYATLCTPSRKLIAREEVRRIENAVAKLPDDQREAILMSRLGGLSYADIGERMQRSETAVRGLVARGLARLTRILHE